MIELPKVSARMPLIERKMVHWFDEQGQYRSGEQLAEVVFAYKFVEGQDNQNSTAWDTLFNYNFQEMITQSKENNENGIPLVVVTGSKMVPRYWLTNNKDDAFRNFIERVAEANDITPEGA